MTARSLSAEEFAGRLGLLERGEWPAGLAAGDAADLAFARRLFALRDRQEAPEPPPWQVGGVAAARAVGAAGWPAQAAMSPARIGPLSGDRGARAGADRAPAAAGRTREASNRRPRLDLVVMTALIAMIAMFAWSTLAPSHPFELPPTVPTAGPPMSNDPRPPERRGAIFGPVDEPTPIASPASTYTMVPGYPPPKTPTIVPIEAATMTDPPGAAETPEPPTGPSPANPTTVPGYPGPTLVPTAEPRATIIGPPPAPTSVPTQPTEVPTAAPSPTAPPTPTVRGGSTATPASPLPTETIVPLPTAEPTLVLQPLTEPRKTPR